MNELLGALVQLVIMSLIPFLCWVLRKDKDVSFFQWIGLYRIKITSKREYLIASGLLIILFPIIGLYIDRLLGDQNFQQANARFQELGFSGMVPVLIFSFIKTGLAEEIFFRGFLGKQLSKKFGFLISNTIQAIIFGLLHGGPMLVTYFGWEVSLFIFLFTSISAWIMGLINMKFSNGSIVSSWLIHGIVNTLSALTILF